jgi:histidinol dehydrogenase
VEIKRLKDLDNSELDTLFNRFGEDFSSIMTETVIPIVRDVEKRGDQAVSEYTEKFDGIKLESLLVRSEEIEEAQRNTDPQILKAFLKARDNIEEFHLRQQREDIIYTRADGTKLGIKYQPIDNAAVYVPGGKASYPSSVLMGVIPAQIAGVENITLITPPDKNGKVSDIILALCRELNVNTILKSGGAQGIAAAGFGTESIQKSDIIVGPGNIYVTAAKTYLFSLGITQIDSMAGPSEVLIIADENANPEWVACDLLSQAEHEEMAIPILLTTSKDLARKVKEEISKDLERGEGRIDIKKSSIKNNGLILITETIKEAIEFSNRFGPEHMEMMVKNPLDYLPVIRNVGSLFLGDYAPVAIGDYFSGTNHILPTGGAARFSSGTSVDTFMRKTTFQMPTRQCLEEAVDPVIKMSKLEGFHDKHGGSLEIRLGKKD